MNKLLTISLALLLIGCAGSFNETRLSYLDRAKIAIDEKKWQVGYRFIEDGLVSDDAATKTRALNMYQANPQLKDAAAETFTLNSLRQTVNSHGAHEGIAIERKRILMYSVVANKAEMQRANDNLEILISEHPEVAKKAMEDARKAAEIEDQKKKVIADALALELELAKSKSAAFFRCGDKIECDKAFALTQIFIATHSDMKIQMANETIIETYNPNKEGAMGASAFRIPMGGATAEIRLALTCKATTLTLAHEHCKKESIRINREFPRFLKERVLN